MQAIRSSTTLPHHARDSMCTVGAVEDACAVVPTVGNVLFVASVSIWRGHRDTLICCADVVIVTGDCLVQATSSFITCVFSARIVVRAGDRCVRAFPINAVIISAGICISAINGH